MYFFRIFIWSKGHLMNLLAIEAWKERWYHYFHDRVGIILIFREKIEYFLCKNSHLWNFEYDKDHVPKERRSIQKSNNSKCYEDLSWAHWFLNSFM